MMDNLTPYQEAVLYAYRLAMHHRRAGDDSVSVFVTVRDTLRSKYPELDAAEMSDVATCVTYQAWQVMLAPSEYTF